jgi:HD-GYP domain-containing protein (c-di-GMP phosphodiesterase class II)/CheY-like chemotaxis protein
MRETLRVLVVEDNQGDVDLIREALSETRFVNFQIDSVSRLSEALARLKNTGIDLVLLDLGLPDSRGLETFRRLLEAKPHIPVIILTGNDNEEMAVAAVREGAQDYLIKGLPWGRLLAHSAQHAIERKQRESRERLVREVLDLLNRPAAAMDTINDILQLIKKGTGFEAVGIRLKEGDDFPYYATNGFPEDFVLAESRLCAYDEEGKIVCDEQGNPVLECMCGNIIFRRTDASLPFFTAGGSFWTNSTSELLASTTEEDRQSRTRNRCNGEGYESVALIPLQTEDEIIGLLQLNDRRRNRFTLEMIHFFEGLGASIGIALTHKRAVKDLRNTLAILRRAVHTTIQVMVSAVELRDPYTSGHQTRSADLARAISTEMELPQDTIESIRMAGSIHDIGKISIPAEILAKPTKLTETEFSLIKEHARKGFEMLKDIESPWPLAEIVYQHHERMDGSGYPRKLKGEEIRIEARILAVADVMEAMASHRPYRPGLGINAALDEIEKNRGTIYDKTVADACLRLFREKGFQLAEA